MTQTAGRVTPETDVTPVDALDLDILAPLAEESRAEGLQFVGRLIKEWNDGTNRFHQPGERFFVARKNVRVIGICGLNVDPYLADESVGRVRRLYVLAAHRGEGVGRRLVESVIHHAKEHFATLRVRTENAAAGRLYERLGFERTTGVPDCTHSLRMNDMLSTKPVAFDK
jgi:ribosomal protein S18 acetylase RimI-like enzyme